MLEQLVHADVRGKMRSSLYVWEKIGLARSMVSFGTYFLPYIAYHQLNISCIAACYIVSTSFNLFSGNDKDCARIPACSNLGG